MNIQHKTALITGGGAGIGLAIAKAFSEKGIRTILTGRNEERLKKAVKEVKDSTYIVGDVSNEKDVARLVQEIKGLKSGLDILVNNAGVGNPQPLDSADGIYEKAKYEMEINYFSVLRLTEKLLPVLKASGDGAIVNIQSIVSYVPNVHIATYSATKAALHSYSQSLRLTLERAGIPIKVFEVFPPFVDTDLTKGFDIEKLSPKVVADDIVEALEKDQYAIRNGNTKGLYQAFRQSPEEALALVNG